MIKGYKEIVENFNGELQIKYNYHTHNYLCGHATGEVYDYVLEGVKNGLEEIGISDHIEEINHNRGNYLVLSSIDKYLSQFKKAEEEFGHRIQILKGGEIEYFPNNDIYYESLLRCLDYLILGQHAYVYKGEIRSVFSKIDVQEEEALVFYDYLKKGLCTGYFSILAHPDMMLKNISKKTDRILKAFEETLCFSKECNVRVELNANGIRHNGFQYPTDELVDIIKRNDIPVIVSSDAHNPKDLIDEYFKDLVNFAISSKLNIQKMVIHNNFKK